jgi:hypothetical protein
LAGSAQFIITHNTRVIYGAERIAPIRLHRR